LIYRCIGEERMSGGGNRHVVFMHGHAVRIHIDVAGCLGPGISNHSDNSSQKS